MVPGSQDERWVELKEIKGKTKGNVWTTLGVKLMNTVVPGVPYYGTGTYLKRRQKRVTSRGEQNQDAVTFSVTILA
jgi:hypothetical protein